MIPYQPPRPLKEIPLIDFSPAYSANPRERAKLAAALRDACVNVGFFYLGNHGVSDAMLAGQLEWAQRVFSLPPEQLEAVSVAHSKAYMGYAGIGAQALDSDTPPDLKESFYVGVDMQADHPYVKAGLPNCGPNQWPDLPDFREHTEAYFAVMGELSRHVMRMLALSLEVDEHWFDPITAKPNNNILRMLRYPPHPSAAKANQLGAGAHTDFAGVTLLLQDDSGGLEVRNCAGEWLRASPVPGTLVVNLGDMMPRWTNDIYISNMHRVLNNVSGRTRHSVAHFFNPDYYTRVECLPSCHSPERPVKYPPCTAGEHIAHMYELTYGRARAARAESDAALRLP